MHASIQNFTIIIFYCTIISVLTPLFHVYEIQGASELHAHIGKKFLPQKLSFFYINTNFFNVGQWLIL